MQRGEETAMHSRKLTAAGFFLTAFILLDIGPFPEPSIADRDVQHNDRMRPLIRVFRFLHVQNPLRC